MADTISVDSTATAGVGHIVRIIGARLGTPKALS